MERLQKVIANSGITSRRKAEELILKGKVRVNGSVVKELGIKVDGNDIIEVDGATINRDIPRVYYLLNKPRGVITSVSDDKERKTVIDYINTDERIYPVGRLDYDTTGALILTNDGELANLLTHPKNQIEKTYIAKIEGILDKDGINSLKKGVVVDNKKVEIKNFKVKEKNFEKNTSLIEITIIEGRNHIVKKIFETLKHPVIRLTRTSIAFININDLKSGEYRKLSIKEVKKLYSLK
ncbi:MAG: rRNA pseudouridine synthase [Firmicutes bacterium]|nr:rRNA pseudouridine synthase [Bacillota bacterium]